MRHFVLYIDYALIALIAITFGLICYKILQYWFPRGTFKPSFEEQVGGDKHRMEEVLEGFEAGLPLLATIAATAPFLGLAGTVMHIIEALRAMAGAAVDISLISGPIATALNSTLVGMASAIPAAVSYNLLQRKLQLMHNRLLRKLENSAQ